MQNKFQKITYICDCESICIKWSFCLSGFVSWGSVFAPAPLTCVSYWRSFMLGGCRCKMTQNPIYHRYCKIRWYYNLCTLMLLITVHILKIPLPSFQPGCVNTTEVDIKKACRMNRHSKMTRVSGCFLIT